MKNPKHMNPNRNRKATAPYNFVPLADDIVSASIAADADRQDIYHGDRYTGVLTCKLETKTPLYTRAALEEYEVRGNQEAKEKADFFYIDPDTKMPVIPGSSLRGVLRSLVEIISYGKLQPVTDRQLFFRTLDGSALSDAYVRRMVAGDRASDGAYPAVQAGYVEKDGSDYYIRPAQELAGTQFYRVEEDLALHFITAHIGSGGLQKMAFNRRPNKGYQWGRAPVWFQPVVPISHKPRSSQFYADVTNIQLRKKGSKPPGKGWQKGWFIASGWVPGPRDSRGKHLHWIIGPVSPQNQRILIEDIDIAAYVEPNAGISQKIESEHMSVLPRNTGELIPCFYTEWKDSNNNKHIAFGHTAMFRLPYENSPKDLLLYSPEMSHRTDFSESLFGWVDNAKGRTIAGRVSISDAHVASEFKGRIFLLEPDEESLTPLLSGPKPTSFQHYLIQEGDDKKELYHYQDKSDTTLRGHKLYWHKNDQLPRSAYHVAKTSENSKQLTVMRPVNQGVPFTFDIHFENVTAEELGALLWILQIAGDGEHCLKVGMAKPLGLGSVNITANLTLSGRIPRYRSLFDQEEWSPIGWVNNQEPLMQTIGEVQERLQQEQSVGITDWPPFISAFETYILSELGEKHLSFAQLERIRMLLTLLRWPGPAADTTAYMQGPNNQGLDNQFRHRPVLPDPLWVTDPSRQRESNRYRNVRTPLNNPLPTTLPVNPELVADIEKYIDSEVAQETIVEANLVKRDSLEDFVKGDRVVGKVVEVIQDSVVVDIGPGNARLHINQVWPPTRDTQRLAKDFYVDRKIEVWVRDRNAKGRIQLTMRNPKK
ncbi:MAG: TIGR03986 family CRISPR-associated RAMP protein [Caldilineaceae bacterium]|nr:TIGR03986 family CRISPR-associated RAMP protein [Caldilineaceae bacterium]